MFPNNLNNLAGAYQKVSLPEATLKDVFLEALASLAAPVRNTAANCTTGPMWPPPIRTMVYPKRAVAGQLRTDLVYVPPPICVRSFVVHVYIDAGLTTTMIGLVGLLWHHGIEVEDTGPAAAPPPLPPAPHTEVMKKESRSPGLALIWPLFSCSP